MKILNFFSRLAFIGIFVGPGIGQAAVVTIVNPWVACGNISQFVQQDGLKYEIQNHPVTQYEYGISYNGPEPVPVIVTGWNQGIRVYNKEPYFVLSDNPLSGTKHGGFILYSGTSAPDDNCGVGHLRFHYWSVGPDNSITVLPYSHGCFGTTNLNLPVFCRQR